ncbi:MAG: cytochrome P450 [Hyphomicrobiales bacterium]|nr:cytochrome P450 [Hyphomicrobiales bacterium]
MLIERVLLRDADMFEKSPVEKRVFARTLGQSVLTADGARWRWQRRAMAPMFRNLEITRDVPEMTRAAEEQVARWRQSPSDQLQAIDKDMVETTFAIITRTMLIGGEPQEAAVIKRETERSLKHISWEMAYGRLGAPTWLPHPATWTLRRSAKKLRAAVAKIVTRRRASDLTDDDLLGRLIAAQDGESGAHMDDEQIIDNLLTLLEAGHETTSRALSWTLYLLARAPEWQARLREEIAAVTAGAAVSAEHLSKLVLTQQVLKESMRLSASPRDGSHVQIGDRTGRRNFVGRRTGRYPDLLHTSASPPVERPGQIRPHTV